MREELWLKLHHSPVLRRLYNQPLLAPAMRAASNLLLPCSTEKILRVKGGLAKGLDFELNPRWEFNLWEGWYEQGVQGVLGKFLAPGKTFYDVGGGIGYFTLIATRMGAHVYTFEPDPENFACIQRHAKRNKLDGKFHLIPLAVFSHTGRITMEASTKDRGHGHARSTIGRQPVGEQFEAACTTLDDFVRQNPAADLIKIDVEGAETDVLKGAERLFRDIRPALVCEVHNPSLSLQIQELLRGHGYRWQWLDDPTYPICRLFATSG